MWRGPAWLSRLWPPVVTRDARRSWRPGQRGLAQEAHVPPSLRRGRLLGACEGLLTRRAPGSGGTHQVAATVPCRGRIRPEGCGRCEQRQGSASVGRQTAVPAVTCGTLIGLLPG